MAILSRPKISPQQRLDLEDFNALLSALRTDAKLYTKQMLSSENLIVKGFQVSGTGLKDATIGMSDATLLIPQNSFDFSWFTSAPVEPDIVIPDSSLTDNARNYVELELCNQDGTPLTKAFWDPEANSGSGAEFNQIVNTVTDLQVKAVVSTGGFSGSPDRLPLAIIDTDVSGNIKIIFDRRSMMFRLARPNDIDNQYAWGLKNEPVYTAVLTGVTGVFVAGEEVTINTETARVVTGGTTNITFNIPTGINYTSGDTITGTTSGATATIDSVTESFAGVDKSISTIKEMIDALMTEILLVKGTRFWWEQSSKSIQGISDSEHTVIVSNTAAANPKWSWSGTELSLTDDNGSPLATDTLARLLTFGKSRYIDLTRQDGQDSSSVLAIGDGEVLYIDRSGLTNKVIDEPGAADTNFKTVAYDSYVQADDNYWLAYREGSRLYIRGNGELQAGETAEVSDNINENILTAIGLATETSLPNYSSTKAITQNSSLIQAISDLDSLVGDLAWKTPVNTFASLPAVGNADGDVRLTLDTNVAYRWDDAQTLWTPITGGSGLKLIGGGTVSITNGTDLVSVIEQLNSSVNVNNPTIDSYSGQTFVVTSEITISAIELALGGSGSPPVGFANLAIWGVDGSNEPDENNIIATATPVDVTGYPDPPPVQFVQFNFPTPVTLAPGTYAWMSDTNDMTAGFLRYRGSTSNPYADGQFYGQTAPPTGPWSTNANFDLYFRILEAQPNSEPAISFTQDMFLEKAGLTYAANTVPTSESPILLPNDKDVAYVVPNLIAPGGNLTPIVDTLDNVPPTAVIIARNDGGEIIVGSSSTRLKIGESMKLYDTETDQHKDKRRGADYGFFRSDDPVTWTGTELQFTKNITFETINRNGTEQEAIVEFADSPLIIGDGQWAWIEMDRNIQSQIVQFQVANNVPALPEAGKDIIVFGKRRDQGPGNGYLHLALHKQVIEPGQSLRLGASGSGSGNANAFRDLLEDRLCDSTFKAVTPYVAEIDQDDATLIDLASTGAFSIVDKRFKLSSIGDTLVSEQLLDATFLADNGSLEKVEVIVKYDDASGIDTAATYEVSRNGGDEYQEVTLERVDTSPVFRGVLNFAQESTQNTLTGDGAITGANLEMNDVTTQAYAQPYTIAAKTLARKLFGNIQDIAGSLQGLISARLVRDDGGSPSLDVNDIILESAPVDLSSVVDGEIEFGITPTVLDTGDYHIVYITDAAYKSVYDNGVVEFSLGANDAGVGAQVFDGTSWSTVAGGFALTHRLEGYELELKLRITSSIADALIEGFGVLYDQELGEISQATTVDGITKVSFNAVADNLNTFALPFLPNQLLTVYLLGSGQSFRYGDFTLSGSTVVFPEDQFNNGNIEKVQTLVFDNVRGETFDNSDVNGALLAANHLGSSDGSIDKSAPGRGIILQRPDGVKVELAIDNDNNITISSVD